VKRKSRHRISSVRRGIFLKQVELHRGLPFAVSIPNAETIAAMKEAAKPSALKRYRSFRDLRQRL
jgi:antitoxin component of RelBE/YafQ-DinJ toxin-antitoxin module